MPGEPPGRLYDRKHPSDSEVYIRTLSHIVSPPRTAVCEPTLVQTMTNIGAQRKEKSDLRNLRPSSMPVLAVWPCSQDKLETSLQKVIPHLGTQWESYAGWCHNHSFPTTGRTGSSANSTLPPIGRLIQSQDSTY